MHIGKHLINAEYVFPNLKFYNINVKYQDQNMAWNKTPNRMF